MPFRLLDSRLITFNSAHALTGQHKSMAISLGLADFIQALLALDVDDASGWVVYGLAH